MEDVQKGGEGSRGGKVIGHTKSGKPIYDHFDHPSHKNFTPHEHYDAATAHADIMDEKIHPEHQKDKWKYHEDQHEKHFDAYSSKMITHKADMIQLKEYHNTINPHLVKGFTDPRTPLELIDDNLKKGLIDQATADAAKAQYNALVKAKGEGSRGGHVIGHTQTGKPIYAKGNSKEDESKFNSKDHLDASRYHDVEAGKHRQAYQSAVGAVAEESHSQLARHHEEQANSHRFQAGEKAKTEHQATLSDDQKKILADKKKKKNAVHEAMYKFHKESHEKLGQLLDAHGDSGSEGYGIRAAIQHHSTQAQHHKDQFDHRD